MRDRPWKHKMKWIPVITKLEWVSLLMSVLWPVPYVFLHWPVWAGAAVSALTCLCGLGAAAVFFCLPEGARREHRQFLGRLPRCGGPVWNLAAVLLWNGWLWYAVLR